MNLLTPEGGGLVACWVPSWRQSCGLNYVIHCQREDVQDDNHTETPTRRHHKTQACFHAKEHDDVGDEELHLLEAGEVLRFMKKIC